MTALLGLGALTLVATALACGARLLTADARMLAYPAVTTIDYGRPG